MTRGLVEEARDPASGPEQPAPDGPGSLAEQAYRSIRELIVSLELRPGASIDERALMERLDIGRTPVREAVRRLAQENLVEVFPRRGMFVTSVEIRDLARLTEVRAVLESDAARLAAERASGEERRELAALIEELRTPGARDGRELIALDERIHRSVYRGTHNAFLEATLEEYFVLALRIWYLALDRDAGSRTRCASTARCSRRSATATARGPTVLMRRHIESFERSMRRVLATEGPEPPSPPAA